MKTIILIIAAITFMAFNSSAQEKKKDLREKLLFGIKAGGNYSNVYDTKGENFVSDPKFGFATGLFVAIPIGAVLGIQPEILYSEKGFKATGTFLGASYKLMRTTSYIDVPLLCAFKPSGSITFLAGPQYSFLLQEKNTFDNGITSVEQVQEFTKNNTRRNTLCFTGGFDINAEHIIFSARAGWDILNNNSDGTSTTPRYKNVWYQATLGYRFY